MVEAVASGRPRPWVARLVRSSGRVNRRSYALVGPGCVAGFIGLAFLVVAVDAGVGVASWTTLAACVGMLLLWVWIMASIKRLHDIGLSGLVMLFVFTPL